MEFRQLEYFLSAAKHLSFTKAAQECCIVQSAMSQQIATLEKDLGIRLFDRTNKGIILTPEGEVMLREAQRLLDQAEMTRSIIRQARNSYLNILRVGCHGNLLRSSLPVALAKFRLDYPRTRVLLDEALYEELLNDLKYDRIDCMVCLYHRQFENMKWACVESIRNEPIYAVLPVGHPLENSDMVSMEDLSETPQILFNGSDKKKLVRDMQDSGIQTSVYAYTESQNCIETLVAAGYGISVCAESAMREHPGIVYRRMSDRPEGQTVLVWKKDNPLSEEIRALLSELLMAQA